MTEPNEVIPQAAYKFGAPCWYPAMGEFQEWGGGRFLVEYEDRPRMRNALPVEFFNHQLAEYDPRSDGDLLALASEYGIPRLAPWAYPDDGLKHDDGYDERRGAMERSRAATGGCLAAQAEAATEAWRRRRPRESDLRGDRVSVEEARYALADMQEWASSLFEWLEGERGDWPPYVQVSRLARVPDVVPRGAEILADSNLTEAVCTQIAGFLIDISEDGKFKLRRCKRCGRLYARFQPLRAGSSDKPPSRSVYCCATCKNRQTKEDFNKRHRAAQGDRRRKGGRP